MSATKELNHLLCQAKVSFERVFDTCSYTHTPDKSQRYYPIQVQYIFGIHLLKHRQIGNNDHNRVTWDPEHARGKVRCE